MKKKKLLFVGVFLLYFSVCCQIPSYYSTINFNVSKAEIKTQLSDLVTVTHLKIIPYTDNTGSPKKIDVWDMLKAGDLDPNDNSKILLMYGYNDVDGISTTDRTRSILLKQGVICIGYWNREHVFAVSLGLPPLTESGTYRAPYTDIHHIRAADCQMNTMRSNWKFGNLSLGGNSQLVGSPTQYFYPGDEWKGDVARIAMYMHIRYGGINDNSDYSYRTSTDKIGIIDSNLPTYSSEIPNIFLLWNSLDPVSELERNRNNVINTYQGNRNPFIDNPYLATYIWGGPDAENTWGLTLSDNEFTINYLSFKSSNVTNSFIEILVNEELIGSDILIYNQLGEIVRKIPVNFESTSNKYIYINVQYLSNGVYFINNSKVFMKKPLKFIKF